MSKAITVYDHTKYRLFEYESHNTNLRLGTILFKGYGEGDQEPEIGVIIQTHDTLLGDEYRTDMWGNGTLGEYGTGIERLATIKEIKKYRPELIPDIFGR